MLISAKYFGMVSIALMAIHCLFISPLIAADKDEYRVAIDRAEALSQQMKHADAAKEYERALALAERSFGPQDMKTAAVLRELAYQYKLLGRERLAEPLYLRSLRIKESILGVNSYELVGILSDLSDLYFVTLQNLRRASIDERCLRITEQQFGKDDYKVTFHLFNLATSCGPGQTQKAESLYLRALRIQERHEATEIPIAKTCCGLSLIYRNRQDYTKALHFAQRCLDLYERFMPADPVQIALCLNDVAKIYTLMGQYSEAESHFQRSVKLLEGISATDADDFVIAAVLQAMANMYAEMGEYAKAEVLYERNLKFAVSSGGDINGLTSTALCKIASFYERFSRNSRQAADALDRAQRLSRNLQEIIPDQGRELLDLNYRTNMRELHVALSFGLAHRDDPEISEQSAGWLCNSKGAEKEALANRMLLFRDKLTDESSAALHDLLAVRAELAAESLRRPNPGQAFEHRRRLVELSMREEDLTTDLNRSVFPPPGMDNWIRLYSIRGSLTRDSIFVNICRFQPCNFAAKGADLRWAPARYIAWIVPPFDHGSVTIVDLGLADEIDRAVELARQAIEQSTTLRNSEADSEKVVRKSLSTLTKLLLDPLKPRLADVKHLILSPDSNLWLVPWAALPINNDTYAIEQWSIRYVTSGRDLVSKKAITVVQSTRPRIFADPNFNLSLEETQDATKAVLRGKSAPLALRALSKRFESGVRKVGRLPGTATEAQMIAPKLQALCGEAPTIYSQQYALEGVLKAIFSPKVLVLSTHGFYLPDSEMAHPNMPGGTDGLLAIDGKVAENPLVRCGVLLAGCNQPQLGADDGIMTGVEIIGCDLRGTDMVVLSACETGLGEVKDGEGVAGLRHAFQLAGASSVISTLWRIPDKETSELMYHFFDALADGKSKSDALRNAQLKLIEGRRDKSGAAHPYYWAAFTVTGQ